MTDTAPTLFDPGERVKALARDVRHDRTAPARTADPVTSKLAAATIKTGSTRAQVLLAFAARPNGLTTDQLCEDLGDRRQSRWRTCTAELRDDYDPPLLVRTEEQRTTRLGQPAFVHRITDEGMACAGRLEDEGFAEGG